MNCLASFLIALLALCTGPAAFCAATFYVAKTGKDANPGSNVSPWLTIARAAATLTAGDTVIIAPGDYNEHVQGSKSGSPGNYITYRAAEPGTVALRAFRLSGQYIRIEGLKLSRYSGANNLWGAAVRIEPTAHNSIVTNCWIIDAPRAIAHDFRFNHLRNEIISQSTDFTAAGFVPGSQIYLGACGLAGLWYTNHDTMWTVASNTAMRLWVTNSNNDRFLPDSGSNYWAVVRPGTVSGFQAISFMISSAAGATNVYISGNTISNWIGNAISLAGRGNVIENNRLTQLNSFRFLSFEGSDHIIRGNIIRDSPNILHFSSPEVSTLEHPAGTGWYDYQIGMLTGFSINNLTARTNIIIERNWFENLENQLGRIDDEQADTYGITYRNNVFIGISGHFSGGRDDMRWISNTFYRCTFDGSSVLALGGRPPSHRGYRITHNLFIDSGPVDKLEDRGWYGISTNAIDPIADLNMVAGPEINGYNAKESFSETNGINGGNPIFLDVNDFDGPDNVPFTADDGLQVLPNSPAALIGGGALGIYKVIRDQPVAHFRVVSPTGWFEPTGTNYNPVWFTLSPTTRGAVQRPFATPAKLGEPPVTVVFDASDSLSGMNGAVSNQGISDYVWMIGDKMHTNTVATFTNKFTSSGDVTVTLLVRNIAGFADTYRNTYRVGEPPTESTRPTPPTSIRVR